MSESLPQVVEEVIGCMHKLDPLFLQRVRGDLLAVQAEVGPAVLSKTLQHFPTECVPSCLDNLIMYKIPISNPLFAEVTLTRPYWSKVCWGHGTDHGGLRGIVASRRVERSFPEPEQQTHGFFCKAVTFDYADCHEQAMEQTLKFPKSRQGQGGVSCGVIFTGIARWTEEWTKTKSPNTWDEQALVASKGIVHSPSAGRWCIREDIAELVFMWLGSQSGASKPAELLIPMSKDRR